jgi:ferredoxin
VPKTIIHYFTGTGNTAHAVQLITGRLLTAGHEVTTIQVCRGVRPPEETVDFHIVAFPVLSWAPPAMMNRYLMRMPRSKEERVAVLAINGAVVYGDKLVLGTTGQGLEEAEHILRRKGYDVFLTGNASFPDNWTQMTNPCDAEAVKRIFEVGDARVQEFADKLLSEARELYRCDTFTKGWTYLVAGLFGRIGRRVFGLCYIADDKCSGCSLCAKTCPAKTIVMENSRPRWKTRCEDCNRCINLCPEKSIQVSLPLLIAHMTANLTLTIWFITVGMDLANLMTFLPAYALLLVKIILVLAAFWLGVWFCLVPLDFVFRLMIQIPAVRRFCCKSHTTKFRRYSAPGFKPEITK